MATGAVHYIIILQVGSFCPLLFSGYSHKGSEPRGQGIESPLFLVDGQITKPSGYNIIYVCVGYSHKN